MKFSCPSCQAKYQLADEKVAGRTVKMKCRKCGTIVPVNADGVVDALAAQNAPMVSLPPQAPSMAATPPGGAPRAGAAPRPGAPAAPRPGAGGSPAAPQVAPRAASPATPAVAPARPLAAGVPPRRASAGVAKPAADILLAEAPPPPSTDAVEMAGPPSMRRLASRAPVAIAEWFAGIGGSPVGPMTREEMKAKVDAGLIERDTLIWRDGMTGWVAIADVPDVSDLLAKREAPAVIHAPAPFAAAIPAPAPPPQATTGLNFEKSAQAEAAFFSPKPEDSKAQPKPAGAILPAPASTNALGGLSASTATIQLPEPDFGMPTKVASSVPPRPSMWMRAKSHVHITKTQIGFAVGAALVFGLAMGFFFFSGNVQTKIVKQIVEVPAQTASASAATPAQPVAVAEVDIDRGATPGTARPSGSNGAVSGTSTATAKTPESGGGLKGLTGLGDLGPTGPNAGAGSTTSTGNSGQPLEASQIQSTVSKYQSGVKRGCWEPALSARDKDAPSSARVTVSINVSSAGAVQSATGSGDPKGYRGLSSCIERRVLAWQFPRSSGSTTVKVPFVFAAQ